MTPPSRSTQLPSPETPPLKIGPAVYASMYFSAASLRPEAALSGLRSTLTRKQWDH